LAIEVPLACKSGATGCEKGIGRPTGADEKMFAVIKTGGKQYKVAANDVLKIEKLDSEPGDVVTFDQVLMIGDGTDVTIGAPIVAGALVAGQLVETKKQKTIIVFKKERRHNYRRRNGHRQLLSTVRITEILIGGAKVTTQPDERAKARFLAAQQANAPAVVSEPAAKKAAAPKAKTAAPKAKAATPAAEAEAKPAKAPKAKAAAEAADFIDDIKLISGVGPALEKKLVGAGVTSLKDIAAWKKADLAKFDEELELHGRAERDEWVEQAKDLIAGKPPRAKSDQELLAHEEKAEKPAKKPAAKKAAPKADKE
jgi:large subunit ribosomal protein L21